MKGTESWIGILGIYFAECVMGLHGRVSVEGDLARSLFNKVMLVAWARADWARWRRRETCRCWCHGHWTCVVEMY